MHGKFSATVWPNPNVFFSVNPLASPKKSSLNISAKRLSHFIGVMEQTNIYKGTLREFFCDFIYQIYQILTNLVGCKLNYSLLCMGCIKNIDNMENHMKYIKISIMQPLSPFFKLYTWGTRCW